MKRTLTRRRPRRGYLLVEMAMATLMLGVAMVLTLKLIAWVGQERRAADRRERAVVEVANLMERLAARPWDDLPAGAVKDATLPASAREALPDAKLSVEVADRGPDTRRITVSLRWGNAAKETDAPVRLTAWITRQEPTQAEARP